MVCITTSKHCVLELIMQNQEATLTGEVASLDISTKKNMNELVKVGEELLKKPVSRVNLDTGEYEPIENGGTNEDALRRSGPINFHSSLSII